MKPRGEITPCILCSTEGYQVIMWPLCSDYECDEHGNVNMTVTCDKLSSPCLHVKHMDVQHGQQTDHSLFHWLDSGTHPIKLNISSRFDQDERRPTGKEDNLYNIYRYESYFIFKETRFLAISVDPGFTTRIIFYLILCKLCIYRSFIETFIQKCYSI